MVLLRKVGGGESDLEIYIEVGEKLSKMSFDLRPNVQRERKTPA